MIVSWVGSFAHEAVEVIEKCRGEVSKSQAQWVIMNLRDLKPAMDRTAIPTFARLQKTVREKPAVLKLSSVHPELRSFLDSQGLLRMEELANNLTEALQMILRESTE
jgi:anti-anti-sigma regulatory factor